MKEKKDILSLVMLDHETLRESIEVLTSEEASLTDKKRHLNRFLKNLRLHTKAEEASFYDGLVELKDLRAQVLEAYEEHSIADTLTFELESMHFESDWTDEVEAKAKVLAELIKHHAEEEEAELFPEARKLLTKKDLENLGEIYLKKRKDFKTELDEQPLLPSLGQFSTTIQEGWKGALHRVSSYVSKISPPR